jgi:hypothetical protein
MYELGTSRKGAKLLVCWWGVTRDVAAVTGRNPAPGRRFNPLRDHKEGVGVASDPTTVEGGGRRNYSGFEGSPAIPARPSRKGTLEVK